MTDETAAMAAERTCEADGCDTPAANNMSWCEKHLNEHEKEERERNSPGWRTAWKQLTVWLGITKSGPDMCCSGRSHRERFPLRLSKLLGLSTFEYRAVPSDGVYTIRRSNRGWGPYREFSYWEWCQCGGWLERGGIAEGQLPNVDTAPRTFASGATADSVAWRLSKGFPIRLEPLGGLFALIVAVATVVGACAEVID